MHVLMHALVHALVHVLVHVLVYVPAHGRVQMTGGDGHRDASAWIRAGIQATLLLSMSSNNLVHVCLRVQRRARRCAM